MLKLGILVSGRGSNLQAILDACAQRRLDAEVALALSNVEGAQALERARQAGVSTGVVDHREFASREAFDQVLTELFNAKGVQLVCLAGFMRMLSPAFLRAFPNRVINIHPSLLPAFPGMHAVRQALEAGVRIAGCTVHFVDEGCDTGPVLVQAAVPVLDSDTEQSLSERILEQEHQAYVLAIDLIARGQVRVEGRKALLATPRLNPGRLFHPVPA